MKKKPFLLFGFRPRGSLTGGELYIRVFQILSLLPLPYILIAPGYTDLIVRRGLLYRVFGLGISALPRWEALGLSLLYRKTGSELMVHFALLIAALILGLAGGKLLRGEKTARTVRIVLSVLLAADLALRALPFRFNPAYGPAAFIPGFLVRAACLALLLLDLRAEKKAAAAAEEKSE